MLKFVRLSLLSVYFVLLVDHVLYRFICTVYRSNEGIFILEDTCSPAVHLNLIEFCRSRLPPLRIESEQQRERGRVQGIWEQRGCEEERIRTTRALEREAHKRTAITRDKTCQTHIHSIVWAAREQSSEC